MEFRSIVRNRKINESSFLGVVHWIPYRSVKMFESKPLFKLFYILGHGKYHSPERANDIKSPLSERYYLLNNSICIFMVD